MIVDAPLDSSGAGRGEERAPAALRRAGLREALAADDDGQIDEARLRDPSRDPASGVIGAAGLVRAGGAIAARIGALIADGHRPLVLGGDCAILPGVCRALPRRPTCGSSTPTRTSSTARPHRPVRPPTWTSRWSPGTAPPPSAPAAR